MIPTFISDTTQPGAKGITAQPAKLNTIVIIGAIKTSGWYLNMNDMNDVCLHNNDINSTCSQCDEEQLRDIWVCNICGKSTYEVDYDYIGTNTNHLGCELKIELKDRSREKKISSISEGFTNRKIQNNYGFKDDDTDYYTGPDGHYEKYGDILHKLPDDE